MRYTKNDKRPVKPMSKGKRDKIAIAIAVAWIPMIYWMLWTATA